MNNWKRAFSFLMAVLLTVSLLPVNALAENDESEMEFSVIEADVLEEFPVFTEEAEDELGDQGLESIGATDIVEEPLEEIPDLIVEFEETVTEEIPEVVDEVEHEEAISEEAEPEETVEEEEPAEEIPETSEEDVEEIPAEAAPEEEISEETAPVEAIPEETTPVETIPEETVAEVPEETTQDEVIPEETVSEETVEEISEDITPETDAPVVEEETEPEEEELTEEDTPEEPDDVKPELQYTGNYEINSVPLEIGTNSVPVYSGTTTYSSFTPKYTGTYRFYTTGSVDTYGYLEDSNGYTYSYNDDGGEGSNFLISYTLTAGETYSVGVRFYSSIAYSDYVTLIVETDALPPKQEQTIVLPANSYSKSNGSSPFSLQASASGNGELSYLSSDTSVASVNEAGEVSINGVGIATITVTASETESYQSCSATVQVTVKPAKTSTPTATRVSTGIKIEWKSVPGVTGYEVYRKASGESSYTMIKSTTSTSYTDTGVATGKSYTYRVRTYQKVYDVTYYSSYTTSKSVRCVKTAKSLTLSNTSTGLKLSWTKDSGATGYKIYRKASGDSAYKLLKTVTTNSYTDTTAKRGTTYYYYVRTYVTVSGTKYYAKDCSAKSLRSLGVATLSSIGATSSGVKLEWTKCTGASGYQIYRKAAGESDYTKIATVKGSSTLKYTDSKATAGVKHTYKVRAYYTSSSGKNSYGAYCSTKSWTPLKLSATSKTLYVGQTASLSVTGGSGTTTWTSSNTGVVKVSSSGTLTAKGTGTATVKAKRNGVTVSCTISVVSPSLNATSISVAMGCQYQLSMNVGGDSVTWSTSDRSIARVTTNGLVTAVGKGSATITATLNGKTYRCTVKTSYPNVRVNLMGLSTERPASTTYYSNRYLVSNNSGTTVYVEDSVMLYAPFGDDTKKSMIAEKEGSYGIHSIVSASDPFVCTSGSSAYLYGFQGTKYYRAYTDSYTALMIKMSGYKFSVVVNGVNGAIEGMKLYEE